MNAWLKRSVKTASACRAAFSALLVVSGAVSPAIAEELRFDGYKMVPVDELSVTRAQSPLTILSGLLPSPEEALPTEVLQVTVRGEGTGLLVEAEARGYLDDSIAGENFRVQLERDGEQWQVIAVGRQVVCARNGLGAPSVDECL